MRLKSQIFLTLLITGVILISLMYLISSWSFSRGFLDYINNSERARLTPMLADLGDRYTQSGSWDWIEGNGREWRRLIDTHVMMRAPGTEQRRKPPPDRAQKTGQRQREKPERKAPPAPGQNPGGRTVPLTLDPRLLLADAEKNLIIGKARPNSGAASRIVWQAITSEGNTVGYLGYRPRKQLTSSFDQLFEQQQKRGLAYAALATIVLSALLSIPVATRIVKPVLTINNAVGKISQGDYRHRLELKRRDELGKLASDINTLSHSLELHQSSRQRWIAEISHELRTPVAVLQGELEAIEDGVRAFDQASVQSLHQEILRLKRLIDDLHDLSLSDLGALNYKMEPLDLTTLVHGFINSHLAEAQSSALNLHYTGTAQKAPVTGDLQRLIQLLQNLLQNTIRYTDPGGKVEVSVQVQSDTATLEWSDSAPGVSDEQLDHLLEPLYRTEASRNRESGGAGLGFAIVSKIVSAHQGKISLGHAGLGGVSVKITLPLNQTGE